jgi:RNA polymerase sigma-70 factor (ECF subfamily)
MDAHARQAALDRARAGEVRALGDLLKSFRPYLRAIVRAVADGRLPARLDDSDLVQDALLEIQGAFAQFRGQTVAEFAVWLRTIAVRSAQHSLSGLLAEKRDPTREQTGADIQSLADSASSPSAAAMRQEQAARVTEAIAKLPADMQAVLLGRHLDGVAYAVLAEHIGRSEGALRVLYVRALDRLRQLLAEPKEQP